MLEDNEWGLTGVVVNSGKVEVYEINSENGFDKIIPLVLYYFSETPSNIIGFSHKPEYNICFNQKLKISNFQRLKEAYEHFEHKDKIPHKYIVSGLEDILSGKPIKEYEHILKPFD